MLSAVTSPVVSLSLLPVLTAVGGGLGVVDAVLRLRKAGGGWAVALLELLLGLLLVVAALPQVHPYVSTTIPVLYLVVPLAVVMVLLLFFRRARKGGFLWLTILGALVNAASAVLALIRLH